MRALTLLILALGLAPGALRSQSTPIDFNRDIRPILSDRCFQCHGFDAKARKAGLRLDTLEGMTTPIEGRHPVVPGKPDESELIRRVHSADIDERMPPPESQLSLSDEEKALLRQWIEEGAPYAPHWAFVPPQPTLMPAVSARGWQRNGIDNFVVARLAKHGLKPSPEADKETLLRRVSLDLTGLPPTLDELDTFVRDERDDAYERQVDRLLASPRFGERLAMVWLDAARYADTNGFHHDNIRTGWPYRDWVIRAFNDNMPFDRFVTEQLAGDLVEDAGESQRIASAFCRMHNINDEGGALDAEYRVEAVCDRIETIATTFMGLTMNCCRCHDHKYDPITQEDYYSLYAFFNSVDERGVYPANFEQARAYPARLLYTTDELREQTAEAQRELGAARDELERATPEIEAERLIRERELVAERGLSWAKLKVVSTIAAHAKLAPQTDGSVLATGKNEATDSYDLVYRTGAKGLRLLHLEALTDPSLGGRVGRASNGNAVITGIEVTATSQRDPKKTQTIEWAWAWANLEQQNGDFDVSNLLAGTGEGWALHGHSDKTARHAMLLAKEPFGFEGGTELRVKLRFESRYAQHSIGRPRVSFARADADLTGDFPVVRSDWWLAGPFGAKSFDAAYDEEFGPEKEAAFARGAKFGKKGWTHKPDIRDGAAYRLNGGNSAFYVARTLYSPTATTLATSFGSDDAIRVFLNGEQVHAKKVFRGVAPDQEQVELELRAGENFLVVKIVNGGGPAGFYGKHAPATGAPGRFGPAALVPEAERTETLHAAYTREWNTERSPTYSKLDAKVQEHQKRIADLEKQAVPVLVMQENEKPTATFVLERGHYEGANEERPVDRRPPTVLGVELPDGAPRNRLGFAQWLVAPQHPLTARVHVNRIWQMLFGAGIVQSSENFGQQADWPSHPQLLDWLSREFIDGGKDRKPWDQKALIRRIVTSATYRQSAVTRRDAKAVDPDNRLLAYFPRRRLQGEIVRDAALFIAGLLVEKTGGPSVRPYQPSGLWREVSIGGSSNTRIFQRDAGEALYRRSLYTFWKRTSPSPQMMTFDAPTREFCVVRRGTTNTPLQALVLWNDEQFVEAARKLAERTIQEVGKDWTYIGAMFRSCTGRHPDSDELRILTKQLRTFRDRYRNAPEDADKLLAIGETKPAPNLDKTELAAWTMVANTILSLDETVVRD